MDLRSNRLARAGAALVLAGGLAGMLAGGSATSQPVSPQQTQRVSPPRAQTVEEWSPRNNPYVKLSEKYAHVRKVGDLTGYSAFCPAVLSEEDRAMRERNGFVSSGMSFISMPKESGREVEYGSFSIAPTYPFSDEPDGSRQIMGVVDFRGNKDISKMYNEGLPVGHLMMFHIKKGDVPMTFYTTEGVARTLERNQFFRYVVSGLVSPKLDLVVVAPGSQAEFFIEGKDCDIGLHNFLPDKPLRKGRYEEPRYLEE